MCMLFACALNLEMELPQQKNTDTTLMHWPNEPPGQTHRLIQPDPNR